MQMIYSRGEYLINFMASKLWFRKIVCETYLFSLYLIVL